MGRNPASHPGGQDGVALASGPRVAGELPPLAEAAALGKRVGGASSTCFGVRGHDPPPSNDQHEGRFLQGSLPCAVCRAGNLKGTWVRRHLASSFALRGTRRNHRDI